MTNNILQNLKIAVLAVAMALGVVLNAMPTSEPANYACGTCEVAPVLVKGSSIIAQDRFGGKDT